MKQIFAVIKSLLINGCFTVLVYLGTFQKVQWVGNLMVFLTILLFLLSILYFLTLEVRSDELKTKSREEQRNRKPWQRFVNNGFSCVNVLLFAAAGWIGCALMYTIHMIIMFVARHIALDYKTPKEKEDELKQEKMQREGLWEVVSANAKREPNKYV